MAKAIKKVVFVFPFDFTLKESDFNDGSITGTSPVIIFSSSSFKAAGDAVWKASLSTSGTALPTGLILKAKRISSSKIQIRFTGMAASHAPAANNVQGVKVNLKSLVDVSDATDIFVTFSFEFLDATPDPINIYNARELQKVNAHPTANYVLANNIDLKGVAWTPIGRATDKEYSGTFDGNSKTIYNLKIGSKTSNAGDYTGLFGETKGATIKNLIIDHVGIWGNDYVGGLVGSSSNTTIISVSMKSTGHAVVTGNNSVGGLIGYINGTVNGYATGDVSGDDYVGGLVGSGSFSTINGYAMGDVSGNDGVGGLVGYVSNTSKGKVSGYEHGKGEDDNALFIRAKKERFKALTIGTKVGQWTLRGGKKWPAINLPSTVGGDYATMSQPTRH